MKTILMLLLFAATLEAQIQIEREVIATSGAEMVNGNLSLDWTLGEPTTEFYTQSDVGVFQGFHTWGRILVATSEIHLPYAIAVYPNPTIDLVYISAETTENLKVTLVDMSGKILKEMALSSLQVGQISLSHLPKALYLLKVEDEAGVSNIFKISKN